MIAGNLRTGLPRPYAVTALRAGAGLLLAAAAVLAAGCASYRGSAVDATAAELTAANGWSVVSNVPFVKQRDPTSCGPAALEMVLRHHGIDVRQEDIVASSASGRARAGELRDFARAAGLAAFVFSGDVATIVHELRQGRPVIVGLAKPYEGNLGVAHYEVVVGYNMASGELATLDPGRGWRKNSLAGFLEEWKPTREVMIAVLPRPPEHVEKPPPKPTSIWDEASWHPRGR